MRVYIVRHGETDFNKKEMYMSNDVSLSSSGANQAQVLATRFKNLPVDLILSSPYERTKETAEIIGKQVDKKVEVVDSLKEIVRPTSFHNKSWNDPEIKEIRDLILSKWADKKWHHSDEENFPELLERTLKLIAMAEKSGKDNILLVTHEGFMKMIIATMMFGQDLTPELMSDVYLFLRVKNTGLTIVEKQKEKWRLITWNDHAHLG